MPDELGALNWPARALDPLDSLEALIAGLEASGRWALEHATAELLFWRPVPSFEPSEESFAVSRERVEVQAAALADAADAGELGPEAKAEEAISQ